MRAAAGPDLLAAFHHHAMQAQWHTVNSLIRFGGGRVDGVASEVVGAVEWWRTIESLVALLYEIAVREGEVGLRPTKMPLNRGFVDSIKKWSAINSWFSSQPFSPASAVTGRLEELRNFRNSFEHTSRADTRPRRHSRLSDSPADAHVLDLMEAMAICVSACDVVRFVLPNVDLMPQVFVPTSGSFFFEAIDVVAREVLVPMFISCLEASGLTTGFSLYEAEQRNPGSALIEVDVGIRTADVRPLPPLKWPVDVQGAYRKFGDSHARRPAPGEFGVPRYLLGR